MFIPHLQALMNSDSSHTGLGINSFNHFQKKKKPKNLVLLWVKLQCARRSMELKGHNLIIISLDSHFSKMERNVLTRHPLPVPLPALGPVE